MSDIAFGEVKPAFLRGEINAPVSKSVLQRLIALAFLAKSKSSIKGFTLSDDVKVAIQIIQDLGAIVSFDKNTIFIDSRQWKAKPELFVGEAGLSTRMFTPIAALLGENITFNGSGSILKRPMDFMADAMLQFGVKLETTDSFLPFTISGQLQGAEATVDGSLSSQLLSGLLMALPLASSDSIITVNNLKSIPYINLTLEVMERGGVEVRNVDNKVFQISGNRSYLGDEYFAEGDWSGAAFWFVAAAVNGNLKIKGLDPLSKQADLAIWEVLKLASVNVDFSNGIFSVQKSKIKAFEFDATHCPDLFPPMAVLAAYADGVSRIFGVERLYQKESNRALALQAEFKKQGIQIELNGNEMLVHGGEVNGGASFNSYHDHRMAMAGAILALKAEQSIKIEGQECVSKSYPDFFKDLESLL